MELFDTSLNSNKKQWLEVLNDERLPSYLRDAITNFFIQDNIDFELYVCNQEANSIVRNQNMSIDDWERINNISVSVDNKKKVTCSQSFRKYFGGHSLERPMGIPDWFIIAYPDVANWVASNGDQIGQIIEEMSDELVDDGKLNNKFFRFTINFYKERISKLELVK